MGLQRNVFEPGTDSSLLAFLALVLYVSLAAGFQGPLLIFQDYSIKEYPIFIQNQLMGICLRFILPFFWTKVYVAFIINLLVNCFIYFERE